MSGKSEDRASELRELFFQSAQELLQALNEQGLALEGNGDAAEAVRSIRRTVHTLKGDAAACGLRELSELAHELEDVLTPATLRANAAALAEVVLSAADMFDAMLTAYRARLAPPSGDPLRALIWKFAQKPAPAAATQDLRPRFAWTEYEQLAISEAAGQGARVYNVAVGIASDCPMRAAGVELLSKVLRQAGTVLAACPEQEQWATAATLEFAIASQRDEQWLLGKCRIPGVVAQVVVEEVKASRVEPIAALEAAAVPVISQAPAGANGAVGKNVTLSDKVLRVEAERIDNLLNLIGELVIGKSMLHQAVNDFARRFPKDPLVVKFADAIAFQSQVLNALQRSAMQIRMVPVEQLFRRFPRLVRDLAKFCAKQVSLEVSGQETGLDKGLLDAVAEPLAHLVRNAVDHGIETAAERRAAGKPEQGTIRLHACHQGHQVMIEVSDDGRGIDPAMLTAKAVEVGMLTAETASHLAREDALELIFTPGFSTAGHLSEISGRGVGMDAVRSAVHKLKGSISIETETGRGTSFRLRLPLTLAIIRGMLFRVSERLYAVPLESVVEITRASAGDIHRVQDREVVEVRNQVLPLVWLAPPQADTAEEHSRKLFVLVIENGDRKFGLAVDKLVGEEELVIKPLDDSVIASEVVSGASILGDGTVALILNPSEVARQFANSALAAPAAPGSGRPAALEASL